MIDIENEAEIEACRRNHEVTTGLLSRLSHMESSQNGEEQVCHFQSVVAKINKLKKNIKKMSNDFPDGKPSEHFDEKHGFWISDFWKDKFHKFVDMKDELATLESLDYLHPCGDCRACVIFEKLSLRETTDSEKLSKDHERLNRKLAEQLSRLRSFNDRKRPMSEHDVTDHSLLDPI